MTTAEQLQASQPARPPVPPLENGDRLTRGEFERRYRAMPHVNKAELIEGTVYTPSPVRIKHGQPHMLLATWLGYYLSRTPGVIGGDNTTCRLDEDNEPQPDLLLMLPPHAGGQAKIDDDGYVAGSPELACEIATSSASIDLHAKLNAYRRNRVLECIVWRTEDRAIDYFVLVDGRFDRQEPEADGLVKSRVFPGLWLHVAALLAGDLARVLQGVEAGTATPEHEALKKRLAAGAGATEPGQ